MRNEELCITPDRAHVADDPREIVFGMAGERTRGAAEIINERGGGTVGEKIYAPMSRPRKGAASIEGWA